MTLKIAIVSPNYYPRTCGVGDNSMRLASEFMRKGIEVAIFTREPAAPHPESPGVLVLGFPSPSPTSGARNILRGLREWHPDEILIQYTPQMLEPWRFGSPAIPLLAARARRAGMHVTVFLHEIYIGWSPRPDLALGSATQRTLLFALMAAADRVIVSTDARLRRIRFLASLAGARNRLEVVRIGSNVLPARERANRDAARLGVFSTFTIGKRFDLVLQAFARVGLRDSASELWLIGDIERIEHAGVRRLRMAISSHPFRDRIVLTGHLPLPEIARIVSSLAVFIHPDAIGATTRSSTLPLPLGSGVPVVAVHGPETDAIFVEDENIVFAPSLSADGFASAAERLLADAEFRRRIGDGGRRLYDEHLAWPKIASRLLAGHS